MTDDSSPDYQEIEKKPVHTIILDASPLLLNTPGISTLLANGHVLVTTPSVLAEIKAEEARNRVETLYKPFLTVRSPNPESLKIVKDFARKTGDGAVLSHTDFEILALAYEIECERNGGDWRLRTTPGQKRLNGGPPPQTQNEVKGEENQDQTPNAEDVVEDLQGQAEKELDSIEEKIDGLRLEEAEGQRDDAAGEAIDETTEEATQPSEHQSESTPPQPTETEGSDSDEGWITPSNIKRRQAQDESAGSGSSKSSPKHLQVATMTGDFAMQNVLLQMNLNLISTKTCQRISQIKQFILRCHACFSTTKDTSKQFCPRCGKPTLTRVTCTTNDKGEVKLHLKKNMQWNNKGNVFSVPKPTSGSANQKWQGARHGGGGKGGWGNELILAEDQKEYVRAMAKMKRDTRREKDLMDEDILPGILSGDRGHSAGRPRVGAGRTVNSRKR
ncbi:uncharacterized protein Z520_05987 [Fonsecaea multimorphosa CBS 102226]|uniref:20S-pre-rRNA D-site endonuclease NOB1 n=1 Tax=Fonsecaea multimorphosa CBS 102226 TaxID=1442371 RepID=A0A0D2INT0_9EURO|nr:uncharacterized protein Z520_05987 [Fonsecaea multimorphosa CBS 102226]KIX98686.1 hypothetical protein Z520_05987 [Fonsecaea multimorphosa CBS 102226]OAL24871.1 hypothetical protein AYO22_05660 [Fonsecaea multimorphosa]